MAKRSKSSSRWISEHVNDQYVQKAQKEGWRSRAVFKLSEIDEREGLIRPGQRIIDLGAAPGGWSQYAASRINGRGRILAVDLLKMDALPDVDFVRGDFTEQGVLNSILQWLGDEQADLVMSDMAPNMSGVNAVDQRTMATWWCAGGSRTSLSWRAAIFTRPTLSAPLPGFPECGRVVR